MRRQINNQESRASPTQTWIALGKLATTYNFAASLFALHNLVAPWMVPKTSSFYHCMVAGIELEKYAPAKKCHTVTSGSPKVVIFAQLRLL